MALKPYRSIIVRRKFDYRKAIMVGVGVGLFVGVLGFIIVSALSAYFTVPAKVRVNVDPALYPTLFPGAESSVTADKAAEHR